MPDDVTFSFGENWQKYLGGIHGAAAQAMEVYLRNWLGDVSDRTLLDVGSGSGLLSLAAHKLGARVTSFDVDAASVAATRSLRIQAGEPEDWVIFTGSILDPVFTSSLATFDVVVSWGVLHHTGRVWDALDGTAGLVAPGGLLLLALYHRTRQSGRSLRTKRLYNRTPAPLKPAVRGAYATAKIAKSLFVRRRLPPIRSYHEERGMDWWRDIEDWLGGLPYEPVSPGAVLSRLRPSGFELVRLEDALSEGSNDVYLFRREGAQ